MNWKGRLVIMSDKWVMILATGIPTLILLFINPILAAILPVAVWFWWMFVMPSQVSKEREQLQKASQQKQEVRK